jgi:hypothetical protein
MAVGRSYIFGQDISLLLVYVRMDETAERYLR